MDEDDWHEPRSAGQKPVLGLVPTEGERAMTQGAEQDHKGYRPVFWSGSVCSNPVPFGVTKLTLIFACDFLGWNTE